MMAGGLGMSADCQEVRCAVAAEAMAGMCVCGPLLQHRAKACVWAVWPCYNTGNGQQNPWV